MGFFAALGSILATADGIAWAFLALAPTLFFLTFLLDGYIGQEGEVHPVANGGFIVSVGALPLRAWRASRSSSPTGSRSRTASPPSSTRPCSPSWCAW